MKFLVRIVLSLCLLSGCKSPAFASQPIPFTTNNIIVAMIGEAEGESFEGKVAVACAILNRGTLKGVYGLHAKRAVRTPRLSKLYLTCLEALREAKKHDITKGSTNWENVNAFGQPYWASSMIKTVKIGNHQFYRKR